MDLSRSAFGEALMSGAPFPALANRVSLYAWFVGKWNLDVTIVKPGGERSSAKGFVVADWVLQGRAIQDVFSVPDLFYGTTLRVYDAVANVWRVSWTDPLNQVFLNLTGRSEGGEIVNEGSETHSLARLYREIPMPQAASIRWIYSDIEPNRFRWRSERSVDGKTWRVQRTYVGTRA